MNKKIKIFRHDEFWKVEQYVNDFINQQNVHVEYISFQTSAYPTLDMERGSRIEFSVMVFYSDTDYLAASSETEAGNAGEQPTRDRR